MPHYYNLNSVESTVKLISKTSAVEIVAGMWYTTKSAGVFAILEGTSPF